MRNNLPLKNQFLFYLVCIIPWTKYTRQSFSLSSFWVWSLKWQWISKAFITFLITFPSQKIYNSFPFCYFYIPQAKIQGGFFFQQMSYKRGGENWDFCTSAFSLVGWGEGKYVVCCFPHHSFLPVFQQSVTVWVRILKYKRGFSSSKKECHAIQSPQAFARSFVIHLPLLKTELLRKLMN